MKTLTVKQLFNIIGNPFALDPTMSYPTIEGSTANFLTYYNTNRENLDRMFVHDFGERLVDFESETDADIEQEWYDEIKAIEQVYIENWARLWYALSEPYNPLYNLDVTEETTYGEHITERTQNIGAQENSSTQYGVANDSVTEKEIAKQSDSLGAQENGSEETSNEHKDTVKRFGNQGITMSTDLVNSEIKLRQSFAFFKTVFQTMIEEIGAYYDSKFL